MIHKTKGDNYSIFNRFNHKLGVQGKEVTEKPKNTTAPFGGHF